MRATKSLRAAVPGPTSRVKGGRSATDRRFGRYAQAGICSTSDQGPGRKASAKANRTGGCALEDLPRSVTRNRGPGVPSPRRDPWRTRCLLPTWKTTNNVSNVAGRSVTSASGSGSRSRASHRKPGPAIEITGSGSARRHRARGHLTGRAVDADRRTAGGASPARPPRRRRHHLRSPGTSPARQPHIGRKARQAARAPSRSRSPAARDASPEDEHRSAAGRSPIAVPAFSRPAAARPLSTQPVGPPVYARRTVLVVWCAFALPPSHFSRRCLVLLLLVAVATGLLARPAEASKRPFAGIVDSAARRHGVDPDLVHAVIAVESGYRATAQSPAGAQGLMQLMPGTQRDLGVSDAFDPRQNVDAGVAYLRRPHRRVRDRARHRRLQRRARRRAALQRHPAIQGDTRLRTGRSRPRPFSCRCTGARRTGPLQRPSARRGRDGRC